MGVSSKKYNYQIYNLSEDEKTKLILKKRGLIRILESSIDIETNLSNAWNVLIDFANWGKWNSFIPEVTGSCSKGAVLDITVKAPELKELNFQPKIYEIEEEKKLVWGGGVWYIAYKGRHEFILENIAPEKIRFTQIEQFKGPIVLFIDKMIRKTAIGYRKMNLEFKAYLEDY